MDHARRLRGPPRRSHKKSRNGCKTCRRRHMRCDETRPECINCTSHGSQCDYGFLLPTRRAREDNPDMGVIQSRIYQNPSSLSPLSLPMNHQRLLSHIVSISTQIEIFGCSDFISYMKKVPSFITIALWHDFVMDSLLAWAAMHIAWTTGSESAVSVGQKCRLLSMQGLQRAVGTFSKDTADAVLAASILMVWQAADPGEYTTLTRGAEMVAVSMRPWKQSSLFRTYLNEQRSFAPLPLVIDHRSDIPKVEDLKPLVKLPQALTRIEKLVTARPEETRILRKITTLVQSLDQNQCIIPADASFSVMAELRQMTFWLPLDILKRVPADPVTMVLLAHIYAMALAVQPLLSVRGGLYFPTISLTPIENIHQELLGLHSKLEHGRWDFGLLLGLMEYPLETLRHFQRKRSMELAVEMEVCPAGQVYVE
ncbi:hypothetical protein BJX99DRAFT_262034 [Aspergillus californicus]